STAPAKASSPKKAGNRPQEKYAPTPKATPGTELAARTRPRLPRAAMFDLRGTGDPEGTGTTAEAVHAEAVDSEAVMRKKALLFVTLLAGACLLAPVGAGAEPAAAEPAAPRTTIAVRTDLGTGWDVGPAGAPRGGLSLAKLFLVD